MWLVHPTRSSYDLKKLACPKAVFDWALNWEYGGRNAYSHSLFFCDWSFWSQKQSLQYCFFAIDPFEVKSKAYSTHKLLFLWHIITFLTEDKKGSALSLLFVLGHCCPWWRVSWCLVASLSCCHQHWCLLTSQMTRLGTLFFVLPHVTWSGQHAWAWCWLASGCMMQLDDWVENCWGLTFIPGLLSRWNQVGAPIKPAICMC
jgi:hypothetical protein